jgi:hypothetical protein
MAEQQQGDSYPFHRPRVPAAELVRRKANREMYSVESCLASMLDKMDFDEQQRWFESDDYTNLPAKVKRGIAHRVQTPLQRIKALADKHGVLIGNLWDRQESEPDWDHDKWERWMQYWEDNEMWMEVHDLYRDAMEEFEALDAKHAD